MPVVNISWLEGRTIEQKRLVVERITAVMAELGVPGSSVTIRFEDHPRENWAVDGQLMADKKPS